MRSRIFFFTLLLAAGAFASPLFAHAAAIPWFGPIVPEDCTAGFGMLVTVINNIIIVLLSIAIVFVAPLMIAYAGFLFVVNPTNPGGKEQAKSVLTNTIVGIVISLAAWMIIAAIMAVLYNPTNSNWSKTWEDLMTSGGAGNECLSQVGSTAGPSNPGGTTGPGVTVVPSRCSFSAPSPITDPEAQKMEDLNGDALIWTNTKPILQTCVNQFIRKLKAGGVVARASSAYRPPAYQKHLYELNQLWCSAGLRFDTTPACSSLKTDVRREMLKHFKSSEKCGKVASGGHSNHAEGIAIDMSGIVNHNKFEKDAAQESCLDWKNIENDPWHYELVRGCSYTCQ